MENKLFFYNMGTREDNQSTFLITMEKDFGIKENDMEMVVSGYDFLFDSETKTTVKVLFFDNGTQLMTVFQGEIAEDTIKVYTAFANRFFNED